MTEKKFKQVCECQNCHNEAEMEITCTLEEERVDNKVQPKVVATAEEGNTKGHAVCSHCGGEADIWLDIT